MSVPHSSGESYDAAPGSSSAQPRVAVAGLGRAGTALAVEFKAARIPLVGLWNRSETEVCPDLGGVPLHFGGDVPPQDLLAGADVILLAVRDDAVEATAGRLPAPPGAVVLHLSGSLGPEVLNGLPDTVHRGRYHPLQAFRPGGCFPEWVPPYRVAIEGDAPALTAAKQLADATGHTPLALTKSGRAAYHCSAVLASNLLVVLEAAAAEVITSAGVSRHEAWPALWPLVAGTLANLQDGQFGEAITGPVARGDSTTVRRNLEALENSPDVGHLYRSLSKVAIRLLGDGLQEEDRHALCRALEVPKRG